MFSYAMNSIVVDAEFQEFVTSRSSSFVEAPWKTTLTSSPLARDLLSLTSAAWSKVKLSVKFAGISWTSLFEIFNLIL